MTFSQLGGLLLLQRFVDGFDKLVVELKGAGQAAEEEMLRGRVQVDGGKSGAVDLAGLLRSVGESGDVFHRGRGVEGAGEARFFRRLHRGLIDGTGEGGHLDAVNGAVRCRGGDHGEDHLHRQLAGNLHLDGGHLKIRRQGRGRGGGGGRRGCCRKRGGGLGILGVLALLPLLVGVVADPRQCRHAADLDGVFLDQVPRFRIHQQGNQRSGRRAAERALGAGPSQQAAEQGLGVAFHFLAETGEQGIEGHGSRWC